MNLNKYWWFQFRQEMEKRKLLERYRKKDLSQKNSGICIMVRECKELSLLKILIYFILRTWKGLESKFSLYNCYSAKTILLSFRKHSSEPSSWNYLLDVIAFN